MIKILYFISLFIWFHPAFAVMSLETKAVNQTIDRFHLAAAEANFDEYFKLFSDDAVFLGTDGNERWTKEEFKTFVIPHFSKGKGWLYESTKRNISLIEGAEVAFFDELLNNNNYGQCRGSGVLIKVDNEWKILQYNLSIPVPNELSDNIVGLIQNAKKTPK
ncbi:MAG: nuclear transport factor 2 family protein [Thalassotalea sp.]|nr:nuclear transport factor 2 family protein [Thalassotalea sp.]